MTHRPKVYLDTDVILDFVLRRDPFFLNAAKVFQAGMMGKITLMASAGSLKDVFYFARKPVGEEKMGSEKRGREAIRILLQIVEVCALDRPMWEEALASPVKDTEDALQVACASRNQADFLVTRNVKHFAGAKHPQIILPDVLLATLEAERGNP
jgi:predicted nucleic acid-binding protein